MPNEFLERERIALREIIGLVQERATGEANLGHDHEERDRQVIAGYQSDRERLTQEFEAEITHFRGEYSQRREETIFHYESNSYAVVQEAEQFDKQAAEERDRDLNRAQRHWKTAKRGAEEHFEEHKDRPRKELERQQRRWDQRIEELRQIGRQMAKVLRRRGVAVPEDQPAVEPGPGEPAEQFQAALQAAGLQLRDLMRQPAAKFREDGWPILIFLFTVLGLVAPNRSLEGLDRWHRCQRRGGRNPGRGDRPVAAPSCTAADRGRTAPLAGFAGPRRNGDARRLADGRAGLERKVQRAGRAAG
jgi:hypothetical protein